MKQLIDLFFTFFKVGLFTFGGGYAMISVVENACVSKKKWITSDEMMNMTVIAESTPGPIAINCATYVGYKQKGLSGSLFATVGVVLPSFIIILLISRFFDGFLQIKLVSYAFHGIKIAVGILIFDVGLKMLRKIKKKPFTVALTLASFIIIMLVNIFAWSFSSINLLIIVAALSLAVCFVKGILEKRDTAK